MQFVQVIDTHTVGHPTRVILDGPGPLEGADVRARRDDFRRRFDRLRGRLLHEPRGHSAMVGVVLTESARADFGAFFISSRVYLDMCGHATVGLARALAASGRLAFSGGKARFSLETPAGAVEVDVRERGDGAVTASILNVPAQVEREGLEIEAEGVARFRATVASCGNRFLLVDAAAQGWEIEPGQAGALCRRGEALKRAANAVLDEPVGQVLFYRDLARDRARHLAMLDAVKFDRSPCGTGTSARLAALHAEGRIGAGETFTAESVLGLAYRCRVEETLPRRGGPPAIRPRIEGEAWLSAFSTLVVEESDPLADGFLCG